MIYIQRICNTSCVNRTKFQFQWFFHKSLRAPLFFSISKFSCELLPRFEMRIDRVCHTFRASHNFPFINVGGSVSVCVYLVFNILRFIIHWHAWIMAEQKWNENATIFPIKLFFTLLSLVLHKIYFSSNDTNNKWTATKRDRDSDRK